MIRKPEGIIKEHAQGGEGSVEFFHVLNADELMGHGTLYAKVVVKPHSSIGYHQHAGNTEPYYILKGRGIFTDNDGTRTEVGPGDACLILPGPEPRPGKSLRRAAGNDGSHHLRTVTAHPMLTER